MPYQPLDVDKLRRLCESVFTSYAFTPAQSAFITDVLLTADLYGIESHGVQRLIRYHKAWLDGEYDPKAEPEIVFQTPVSATVDAHHAMGQLAGKFAMELAIEKARATGIGMVAVRGSNHYGIAGYFSKMASDADLIGVCMTNTEAIMVPTHGRRAMLGTNPIAVAMPADPTPFLFDAATTVVPRGKLEVYRKMGKPLEHGWAVDAAGRDSQNTGEVLDNIIGKLGGGILPLGGSSELQSGYKGYGFGLICELFTSIMAGGDTANHAVGPGKNDISHGFWAIDYGIFGDKAGIRARFSTFLQELRDSDKAEGQSRIYIHGEKELESHAVKLREGVPVNEKTFSELRDIAGERGVAFPF